MNRTTIEWVKNIDGSQGYTCNPMTGCLNCIEGKCGGVFPCYAFKQSLGRCHQRDLEGVPVEYYGEGSFVPRIHPQRFDQLDNAPKGAGIFVCDRSDWAANYWPGWCQERILNSARKRPDIRLYLLTKQPQELPKFSPFPDNCWVGVSAINRDMAKRACEYLGQVQARVKFLSIEPMLEDCWVLPSTLAVAGVKWVIVGAQTKPNVYPRVDWVEWFAMMGIGVFLKNNLRNILPKETPYYHPVCAPVEVRDPCIDCDAREECHADGRWQALRQELPER